MQELRLVAVSEDGAYVVLTAPGSGGRFSLPIDDRLRIVARGQFSRLAQYEIEVESPLRPKEIQDRIRAGETAEEIADAAGLPIERVRRFEGPVLAERAYRAQEAQGATVRHPGDSGPGRRLGDVVSERLRALGADPDESEWDSRKRPDGDWLVQLTFTSDGQHYVGEWVFDPRRKHISPAEDTAARLCLPEADLPGAPQLARAAATATVTPIGSRLGGPDHDQHRHPERDARRQAARGAPRQTEETRRQPSRPQVPAQARPAPAESGQEEAAGPAGQTSGRPSRKAAGSRSRRSSVPSWDEIMFGTSRNPD